MRGKRQFVFKNEQEKREKMKSRKDKQKREKERGKKEKREKPALSLFSVPVVQPTPGLKTRHPHPHPPFSRLELSSVGSLPRLRIYLSFSIPE